MDINVHIDRTEKSLTQRKYIISVDSIKIRKLPPPNNRAEIKAIIHFFGGSYLCFSEVVETGKSYPQILKYSYQYLYDNLQIFRYDDSPHHYDLPNFPHHKHKGSEDNEIIESAYPPNHDNLFEEITCLIESKLG